MYTILYLLQIIAITTWNWWSIFDVFFLWFFRTEIFESQLISLGFFKFIFSLFPFLSSWFVMVRHLTTRTNHNNNLQFDKMILSNVDIDTQNAMPMFVDSFIYELVNTLHNSRYITYHCNRKFGRGEWLIASWNNSYRIS